ncbi:Uncharacterised protein [uncultured archaeon]|nr:Uncharacterised protein [uncultured archaeon]
MQKKAHKFEGQIFGRLFVVKRLENAVMPSGAVFSKWLCRCVCGNEKSVLGIDLKAGKTQSCGCLFKETTKQKGLANRTHGGYSRGSDTEHLVKYRAWKSIQNRCRERGYESDLELSDLPAVGDFCPVFGTRFEKLQKGSLWKHDHAPSIDRMNPNLPYLRKYKGNLCFISWRANRLKMNGTAEEFQKIIGYMMRGTEISEKSSLMDSKPSQFGGNEAEAKSAVRD